LTGVVVIGEVPGWQDEKWLKMGAGLGAGFSRMWEFNVVRKVQLAGGGSEVRWVEGRRDMK
jgi:hypothetical protein